MPLMPEIVGEMVFPDALLPFLGKTVFCWGYRTIIRLSYTLVAPVVLAFSLAGSVWAAWALLPFLGKTVFCWSDR